MNVDDDDDDDVAHWSFTRIYQQLDTEDYWQDRAPMFDIVNVLKLK